MIVAIKNRDGRFLQKNKPRFVEISRLEEMLKAGWWSKREEIITAYRSTGLSGIKSVTGFCDQHTRVVAVRLGLRPSTSTYRTIEEIVRIQKIKNLQSLEAFWAWKPGVREIRLKRFKRKTAKAGFRYGGMRFIPGDVYLQFQVPIGAVRKYLLEHGVENVVADGHKIPLASLKKGATVCVKVECAPKKQSWVSDS